MTKVRLGFLLLLCCFCATASAVAAGRMQFWNLTAGTIQHLYLSPAGKNQWGSDQCANDPDGTVDADERLKLTDLSPGRYDVKVVDSRGRTCLIRNIELRGDRPYAFSLAEPDLRNCSK